MLDKFTINTNLHRIFENNIIIDLTRDIPLFLELKDR